MPKGLTFHRHFTASLNGIHPYDAIDWERRTAEILDGNGNSVFRQEGVEMPDFWSKDAVNIVVSKYFHGQLGSSEREFSLRQLIDRVVGAITSHGVANDYFSQTQAKIFSEELTYLLVHQMVAFNSPVWFNLGVSTHPQVSACFINSIEDDMESILDLIKTEGLIFKRGSGSGTNLSKLREADAPLSGGGSASGPLSFMKALDASAGVIKSGGGTRRAAILRCLDDDHPDLLDFIDCKVHEERKAHALIREGYASSFTGEAYATVAYQNANNSVQVSDEFMRAVKDDQEWELHSRVDGHVTATHPTKDIFRRIAQAAWETGDPGLQFSDTINYWNTLLQTDRIVASNPCSEYLLINDSSCNLASFNLLPFLNKASQFDFPMLEHASEIIIIAMEILCDLAAYPTPKITEVTKNTRPLGLGFSNLGTLLMVMGLPYDSDHGRQLATWITSTIAATSYAQSARIAAIKGPFALFAENRDTMLEVVRRHRDLAATLELPPNMVALWDRALELGVGHGYRNSQVVVIAPSGTISFFMGCTTTGLEPNLSLVSYKKMVGEGLVKLVNSDVYKSLKTLDYDDYSTASIIAHLEKTGTIEGAPGLDQTDLPVFDCSFKPAEGTRSIDWTAHIKMLAAIQPFLSGGASKTINMPYSTTVEDIERAYTMAWELGCKCISVYRDGCKLSQPVSTSKKQALGQGPTTGTTLARRKLSADRPSKTHHFTIGEHEGYVTAGMYPDGDPAEVFITMAKAGSTTRGSNDVIGILISLALQYGVPVSKLIEKLANQQYAPQGFTGNPSIRSAKSPVDYIAHWLALEFGSAEDREQLGMASPASVPGELSPDPVRAITADNSIGSPTAESRLAHPADLGEPCPTCGNLTQQTGACRTCASCGWNGGCG